MNIYYRWIGTITYLIGMILTALNIYPYNLIGHTLGATFWTIAAVQVKDIPLTVIESIAILTYSTGMILFLYKSFQ